MFLGKKKKEDGQKCESCGSRSSQKYSFCPHCGNNFFDLRAEEDEFGLLGRDDLSSGTGGMAPHGFGVMDKMLSSMVNSLMKNLDKQFREQTKDFEGNDGRAEIRTFPNGIKIKIVGPFDSKLPKKRVNRIVSMREIDSSKLKKISSMPKGKAKTNVKRFGDRIVYELLTPGVTSLDDVFVSKLESGYEVKAIGEKKVYVNSVPIKLPLKRFSIMNGKVLVEFLAGGE